MRGLAALLLGLSCALGQGHVAAQSARRPAAAIPSTAATGSLQVAFSPWDDVEALVVGAIGAARSEVLVQSYSFTSRPIAQALIAAQRRGVDVRVTVDREQAFSGDASRVPELAAAGIPVFVEVRYAAAHNKVMVIDPGLADAAVITGSYNWTWSAQNRNAENVLIVRRNAELTRRYALNWHRHAGEAIPYDLVRDENFATR